MSLGEDTVFKSEEALKKADRELPKNRKRAFCKIFFSRFIIYPFSIYCFNHTPFGETLYFLAK